MTPAAASQGKRAYQKTCRRLPLGPPCTRGVWVASLLVVRCWSLLSGVKVLLIIMSYRGSDGGRSHCQTKIEYPYSPVTDIIMASLSASLTDTDD
jgi:hypothetical protein